VAGLTEDQTEGGRRRTLQDEGPHKGAHGSEGGLTRLAFSFLSQQAGARTGRKIKVPSSDFQRPQKLRNQDFFHFADQTLAAKKLPKEHFGLQRSQVSF
jgi:hypothetical protein